jgi:hypothetical protein
MTDSHTDIRCILRHDRLAYRHKTYITIWQTRIQTQDVYYDMTNSHTDTRRILRHDRLAYRHKTYITTWQTRIQTQDVYYEITDSHTDTKRILRHDRLAYRHKTKINKRWRGSVAGDCAPHDVSELLRSILIWIHTFRKTLPTVWKPASQRM